MQSLENAVFKAIDLCRNATEQTVRKVQRAQTDLEVVYVSEEENEDAKVQSLHHVARLVCVTREGGRSKCLS